MADRTTLAESPVERTGTEKGKIRHLHHGNFKSAGAHMPAVRRGARGLEASGRRAQRRCEAGCEVGAGRAAGTIGGPRDEDHAGQRGLSSRRMGVHKRPWRCSADGPLQLATAKELACHVAEESRLTEANQCAQTERRVVKPRVGRTYVRLGAEPRERQNNAGNGWSVEDEAPARCIKKSENARDARARRSAGTGQRRKTGEGGKRDAETTAASSGETRRWNS